jgi:hypothetical protein
MRDNRHARRSASHKAGSTARTLHGVRHTRTVAIWLAFLALIIQVLVVQSHIHIPQAGGKSQNAAQVTVVPGTGSDVRGSGPHDKYPVNEDPWNCPLCQELAHSGQFVAGTAVLVWLAYFISVSFILVSESIRSFFAVSHSWHGRAPPLR